MIYTISRLDMLAKVKEGIDGPKITRPVSKGALRPRGKGRESKVELGRG